MIFKTHFEIIFTPVPILNFTVDDTFMYLKGIIDTGSDITLFPLSWLKKLGHNNNNLVFDDTLSGVGGKAKYYLHTVQIKILDKNCDYVWDSQKIKVGFIESLNKLDKALFGRDIIFSMWNSINFNTNSHRYDLWEVSINT